MTVNFIRLQHLKFLVTAISSFREIRELNRHVINTMVDFLRLLATEIWGQFACLSDNNATRNKTSADILMRKRWSSLGPTHKERSESGEEWVNAYITFWLKPFITARKHVR